LILPYIKQALSSRYRGKDFEEYFAFLESRPITNTGQKHHILPASVKSFFPYASDPNNLILLSVEDHNAAHLLLGKAEPWLLRTARRSRGY
jgi:hypothetical protein